MDFSPALQKVIAAIPQEVTAYLVGGAVRDLLLNRPTHDHDFLLAGDVLPLSRKIADSLGGAFFPLDKDRGYARVILNLPAGERFVVDFAPIKEGNLENDLRSRDFTLNAMAVDVRNTQALMDPLGGAADLHARRLRACSSTALRDDPVRVLRAVRLAVNFSLRILPETSSLVRQAAPLLLLVSPERVRDEVMKMLANSQPASAVRLLDILDALPYVFPDLPALKGVDQSPPHIHDVWEHTLDVLNRLEMLFGILERDYDPDQAASLLLGLAVVRLGRYREQIAAHLETLFTPDRSLRPLLFLAALYHDSAKPGTRQVEDNGRIRFFGHDELGARLARQRGAALRLSSDEILRLETIVCGHMRPLLLAQAADQPTRRAIYRFFRDLGPAGVDICLLSLADTLATYGTTLPVETWSRLLNVVRTLFEAYWENPQERIQPPVILDGHDLMTTFRLAPGPKIGTLLEALREAQATGQVSNRAEAVAYVQQLLDQG